MSRGPLRSWGRDVLLVRFCNVQQPTSHACNNSLHQQPAPTAGTSTNGSEMAWLHASLPCWNNPCNKTLPPAHVGRGSSVSCPCCCQGAGRAKKGNSRSAGLSQGPQMPAAGGSLVLEVAKQHCPAGLLPRAAACQELDPACHTSLQSLDQIAEITAAILSTAMLCKAIVRRMSAKRAVLRMFD